MSARYLPLILWHDRTPELDANAHLVADGHSMIPDLNRPAGADGKVTYFEPQAYWMVRTRQHQLASLYPVVTPVASMLVDMLAPIARQRSLGDVVERARRHLAGQIENDGLVRYHGLPDDPTIGRLGCVITRDSDDTALAWRIAARGADNPRQQRMLGELAHYRDANWLRAVAPAL